LADQKLNREEILMQTLTMNEQEMVAGGESWAYESAMAPNYSAILSAVAMGAAKSAPAFAAAGAAAGSVGGFAVAPVILGAAGGALFGAGFGASMVLLDFSMNGYPMNRGRVTIYEDVNSGSSNNSSMDGSLCY
jgi:hypothetical protein